MKTSPSSEYTSYEEGTERRPAKLYHIWRGETHWRYTSGLKPIVYNGNTYYSAPIKRGAIQRDSDINADTVNIDCARTMPPINEYTSYNLVDAIWVTVYNVFWNQNPIEAMPIFSGLIEKITSQGPSARMSCVSLEFFLNRNIPRYRYQPGCNHTLYGTQCGETEADFQTTALVGAISANKFTLTLSGATFEGNAEPYYLLGNLYFGDHLRMIVGHSGLTVTMRYAIDILEVGDEVTVSAGCDKVKETCRDKFNNIDNFFGFPYVAFENPVLKALM